MRLTDLLHPHLDGVTTVVDATDGGLDLEPYLHLPGEVALHHGERDIGESELVLVSYGPDPALHGTETDCLAVLRRMRPGGRGVILFGHRGPDIPYHRLLDALVAHRCQVLRAAPLDYTHLHAGAVFVRTDVLLPLHDWFGRPVPAEGFATALRIADEYVLADLVSRSLRARVLDLERDAEEAERARGPVHEDGLAERLAAAVREKEQLAAALHGARQRVGLLQARVAMLEGSTSLRVGRALVSAARSPRREAPRLPRELYGLWRRRMKSRSTATTSRAVAQAGVRRAVPDGRMHLAHRAFAATPRDRLVIAGVLTDATAADLAADAVVNRVLPHDGRLVVQRTDPDALLVQLSACTGHGPWSLTGTGLAPDLDRRLAELLTETRAAGRPCVLWRDAPASAAPGLTRLDWDAVLDADAGVRLASLDPAAAGRRRLREVFRADSTRVRLSQLARRIGGPDPLDQRRVCVLAAPRDRADVARLAAQVLSQRHRPAEVVVPDPTGLDELTAAGVTVRTGEPLAPWVADWTDLTEDRPDTLLLDLMCAQEYSCADAVGSTPAADDYTFVPELRPLLVRRSLLASGTPPETWARQGHRLFAWCGKEPT
ncbi:hypothetical protein [Streptomyces chromofuscus]|uniref:Uncharacterized protein n=1 Tax=Streptomyces chromofuscus TaxID=42881 RepID=A0A7M2TD98_STRCW|nr:hypothetical protein [Streptomyces chromofuscus]QOV46472.1 hypothetical protein IPT68_11525 [Streptomyces chromofuscus]GGS94032.1 hypothetical protein GCM10010254_12420 [Streptomyces chromofuscus]